jgi:hypothetical protein
MRWTGIYEFWSDLLEKGTKNLSENKKRYSFDLRTWVERGDVVLGLTVFNEIQSESVTANITPPTGSEKSVSFTKEKPGYYTAKIQNGSAGRYQAALSIGGSPLPPVAWNLSGEFFGERRYPSPNIALLNTVALNSGGKVNPSSDDILPHLKSSLASISYSPHCLALALLSLLIEMIVRLLLRRRTNRRALV